MFKSLLMFHQIDSEHLAHEKEKRLIKETQTSKEVNEPTYTLRQAFYTTNNNNHKYYYFGQLLS